MNKGHGPTLENHFIVDIAFRNQPTEFHIEDLNGDFFNDIVAVTNRGFVVALNDGFQNFGAPFVVDSLNRHSPRYGAIIGSTEKDIILGTRGEGLRWYYASNSSESLEYSFKIIPGTESIATIGHIRTMSVDDSDFAVLMVLCQTDSTSSSNALYRYSFFEADDEYYFTGTITTNCSMYGGFNIGDVNGDGNIDVVCRRSTDNLDLVLIMSVNHGASESLIDTGTDEDAVHIGFNFLDIDLDGDQDILYSASGTYLKFEVAENIDGTGDSWAIQKYNFYDEYYILSKKVVADFDGDGFIDVAVTLRAPYQSWSHLAWFRNGASWSSV